MCTSLRGPGDRVGERDADRATSAPDRRGWQRFLRVSARRHRETRPGISDRVGTRPVSILVVATGPDVRGIRGGFGRSRDANPVEALHRKVARHDVRQVERRFRSPKSILQSPALRKVCRWRSSREAIGNGRGRGCGNGAGSLCREASGVGGRRAWVLGAFRKDLGGDQSPWKDRASLRWQRRGGRYGPGDGARPRSRRSRPRGLWNIASGNGGGGRGSARRGGTARGQRPR